MAGKVLITGGNGYIARFLIQRLAASGWRIRATLRDPSKAAALRRALGVEEERLSFFCADLMHDAGWAEALSGCTHVAHLASPLPSGVPESEEEVIAPARDGALRVLRFARDAGAKRFVLASSIGAIGYGRPKGDYLFTEADWTDTTHPDTHAYVNSKTISERCARDWMVTEGGAMEFC
jgi:nucleoside-diphosphate-sugar epimerase